ncbi:MAG: molybdate ABC transporter substrate-binding protein [Novosphingobium sp.]|nr:molybdate ABC transporter substrate-binding protein [Novosphingobium sp.]
MVILASILAVLGLGYLVSGRDHGPIVLAASSLQEALEEAADSWAAKGNPKPVLSFAGTAALARQIESGAPADLFISADEKWMDEVAGQQLIDHASRASFLTNSLVLIAPKASEVMLDPQPNFAIGKALNGGRLAMADPDTVPAGRYARQSLRTLNVWQDVSRHLAVTENVRQALALVAHAEAPIGIVYLTDARAESEVRVVAVLPDHSHARISYPVARLAGSKNVDAEPFREFLLSEEAKAIFRRHGFGAP